RQQGRSSLGRTQADRRREEPPRRRRRDRLPRRERDAPARRRPERRQLSLLERPARAFRPRRCDEGRLRRDPLAQRLRRKAQPPVRRPDLHHRGREGHRQPASDRAGAPPMSAPAQQRRSARHHANRASRIGLASLAALALAALGVAAQAPVPASEIVPGNFVDATAQAGVHFLHQAPHTSKKYLIETMGSGVALFDYDNDGRLDIFLVNGAPHSDPTPKGTIPKKTDPQYWNRLYYQKSD